jgi:gas vesicle protein
MDLDLHGDYVISQQHIRKKQMSILHGIIFNLTQIPFSSFVTCISVYRGKSSVLEHTVAGIMTGSMYKINLGLRGMVAGGLVGGVLGTMAGTVTYGVLLLTGKTMEELRQYQYQWSSTRKEATFEATKKQLEGTELSDTMGIMEYHDRQLSRHNIDLKKVSELIEKEQAELKAEELKKSETKDVQ